MAVIFHRREFDGWLNRRIERYLTAMALEYHRIVRVDLSRSNPGVTVQITRPRAGGRATQRTVYPQSSRPGEPPRRRTGLGMENTVWGYNAMLQEARVGFARGARHLFYHELGINYRRVGHQQRPSLVPALRRNRARLVQIGRAAAEGTL